MGALNCEFDAVIRRLREPASQEELTDALTQSLAFLSDQERKCLALDAGLLGDVLAHLISAQDEGDATLAGQHPEEIRTLLVRVLEKLILFMHGRQRLVAAHSVADVLLLLKDPCATVRAHVASILVELSLAHDFATTLLEAGAMDAVVACLFDSDQSVSFRACAAVAQLTNFHFDVSFDTVSQLVKLLHQANSAFETEVTQSILRALWNLTSDLLMKELAIDCQVIESIALFLGEPVIGGLAEPTEIRHKTSEEIVRLTCGTVMSLSVAERGKAAAIRTPVILEGICRLASSDDTASDVSANCRISIGNICENPKGLVLCSDHLISRPPKTIVAILGSHKAARIVLPRLTIRDGLTEAQRVERRGIQLSALDTLFFVLTEADDGVSAAWSCLNIVGTLCDVVSFDFESQDDDRATVAQRALSCLAKLTTQHAMARDVLRRRCAQDSLLSSFLSKEAELKEIVSSHEAATF